MRIGIYKRYLIGFIVIYGIAFNNLCRSFAGDVDVDAFLTVREVISISKTNDINFGKVSFGASPSGYLELGTNGAVALDNTSSDLFIDGGGTAGSITISGDDNSAVDIACDTSAVLADTSGKNLFVSNIEIDFTGSDHGTGKPCSGLDTPVLENNFSLNASAAVLIGARVDLTGVTSGNYSTAENGGEAITMRVTYQ